VPAEPDALLDTSEVRWFLPGALPPAVQRWFVDAVAAVGGDAPDEPDRRTDHYLVAVPDDSLGIKVRAGADVEVKARIRDVGEVGLGQDVAGRLERWRKWSIPISTGSVPVDSGWLAVDKSRLSVTVRLGEGAVCSVEVTNVTAAHEEWWTLGFEATGELDAVEDTVRAAATATFRRPPPMELSAKDSFGYPAWLRRFAPTE
jgi:hypothetical protein